MERSLFYLDDIFKLVILLYHINSGETKWFKNEKEAGHRIIYVI